MAASTVSDPLRRSLIEGTLATLRDPQAKKAAAIQMAAIALGADSDRIRVKALAEPSKVEVTRTIGMLEEALRRKQWRDRNGKWIDMPDLPEAKLPKGAEIRDKPGADAPEVPRPSRPSSNGKSAPTPRKKSLGPSESDDPAVATPDDPDVIDVGSDVNKAADLLAQGKKVRLNQPREVSTLVHELARRVREAKELGEKAPDYDLCRVTVKGTNLFCAESKGIPRIKMPQLSGIPTPGTKADALPKNDKGEVDLGPSFRKMLTDRGFSIADETEKASYLRASQDQLNGIKVAGMTKVLDDGGALGGDPRIFVSQDNYVVDGHHRWAANVAHDLIDDKLGDVDMQVARVNMPIIELLDEANRYAAEMGIPQAGVGAILPDEKAQLEKDLGLDDKKVQEAVADGPPQNAAMRPDEVPAKKNKRGKERAAGGTGDEPKDRAGKEPTDKEFEEMHPRGRGGVWIKKGEGTTGQPEPRVAQLQRRLVQLGYGPGAPDGAMGPLTQRAVAAFQTDYGLQATGEVDPATAQLLANPPAQKVAEVQAEQRALAAVPDASGSTTTPPGTGGAGGESAPTTTDATDSSAAVATAAGGSAGADSNWRDTGAGRRNVTLSNGVMVAVDGKQYDRLKADGLIDETRTPSLPGDDGEAAGPAEAKPTSTGSSRQSSAGTEGTKEKGKKDLIAEGDSGETVRVVQQALEALGYDLGKSGVDGDFGAYTDRAIRKLQREHGLRADGKVGRRTQRLLRRLLRREKERASDKSVVKSADELREEAVAHVKSLRARLYEAEEMADVYERYGDVEGVIRSRAEAQVYRAKIAEAQVADVPKVATAPRRAAKVTLTEGAVMADGVYERFNEATVDRMLAEADGDTMAFTSARANEMALARQIVEQVAGRYDATSARAARMLGIRSVTVDAVLAEAEGCTMPHAKMSKKGMLKCPKCDEKIGKVRNTVEEAFEGSFDTAAAATLLESVDLGPEDHRTIIRFMQEAEWEIVESRAAEYDAMDLMEAVDSRTLPDLPNKPGKTNWIEKAGGLPKYIERIAKHLKAKGKSTSHAIAIAVNVVKKMCAGGDTNLPGVQQVNAKSRAQACKAVAEWESKKARSKAKGGD